MNCSVKMRISKSQHCRCDGCGKPIEKEHKEFFDVMIGEHMCHLCYDCVDVLFHKTLTAQCNYNHKVKDPKKLSAAYAWDEKVRKKKELDDRWSRAENE